MATHHLGLWGGLVLAVVLASAMPDTVRPLEAETALLQEALGLGKAFSHDTKGVLPPDTELLRTVNGVSNERCLFVCNEEPNCSAYKWTGNDNKCTLLQAPSHLKSNTANRQWHLAAASLTELPHENSDSKVRPEALASASNQMRADLPGRGTINFKHAMRVTIHQIKGDTELAVAQAKTKAERKEATVMGDYKKQQVKIFESKNKIKYQKELANRVKFQATEQAKADIRQPDKISKLVAASAPSGEVGKQKVVPVNKIVDKLVVKEEKQFEGILKGHIARSLSRQFTREMEEFVNNQAANFAIKAAKQEKAVILTQIDKSQSAAKKADVKKAQDNKEKLLKKIKVNTSLKV